MTWQRRWPESIANGEIHLWRCHLDEVEEEAGLLPPGERERLRNPHRLRSRIFLRSVLGHYLGLHPAKVKLETAPGGKPFLPHQRLQFNLSHAGDLALLAVSDGLPLGIDLEARREVIHWRRIAQRLFHRETRLELEKAPPALRSDLFLHHWTRFEARQKLTGAGLFGKQTADATVHAFIPADDCMAALAWPGGETATLRFFQFPGRKE